MEDMERPVHTENLTSLEWTASVEDLPFISEHDELARSGFLSEISAKPGGLMRLCQSTEGLGNIVHPILMLDGQQHGPVFCNLSCVFTSSIHLFDDDGPTRCWQSVVCCLNFDWFVSDWPMVRGNHLEFAVARRG